MKSVLILCIGLFLPILLYCQNPLRNTLEGKLLEKPYLLVNNKNKVSEKLLSVYKEYSKLNASHSSAKLSLKQSLDSIIKVPYDTTFASHKSAFTYNSNGNITSSSEYDWDKTSQNWYYTTKKEWVYNPNHYNTSYITYYGDQQSWYNELKYDNHYDQKGRLDTVLGYGWNESTNSWDIGLKVENKYDAAGRDTSSITYEWDLTNSKWNPTGRVTSDYGDTLVVIKYIWEANKWKYSEKEEYTYYFFGTENYYTLFQWDGSGDWANIYQSKTGFVSYGNDYKISIVNEYNWDVISVIWVNSKKTDYKYLSVDTNMIQSTNSKYVKQLQNFILDSKDVCVYQNQYANSDLLLPPDLKFTLNIPRISDNSAYFMHMLLRDTNFIHNGTIYVPNYIKSFYWSPINVTKTDNQISVSDIELMPNPASGHITIVSADPVSMDFNLFDLNGKLKISKKIHSNETISTEELAKGIYVYRIISNNKKLQSGKLIVN